MYPFNCYSLAHSCFRSLVLILSGVVGWEAAARADAAVSPQPVQLTIHADRPVGKVSPTLYGLMTEEINFSYEGGLYGELVRNRSFKASHSEPKYWQPVGNASLTLDTNAPLNGALNVSLKLVAEQAGDGVANPGYWGIPVHPHKHYHASLYAKTDGNFHGTLTVAIVNTNTGKVLAREKITGIGSEWHPYELVLTTSYWIDSSKSNCLTLTLDGPGTVWLQQVSLFPPTYLGRTNGNRTDLMELQAAMRPAFLRLPGGNYLEGDTFAERFNWKNTIGPVEQRPGHRSPWNYWSTDGLGLLEYLEWCEDLHMEPLLAVFAGYTLKHDHVDAGPALQPYVQEALDEIEYVTGDASTVWGARRVADGHPAPFPLHYIEIGNEDTFDRSGSYDGRFAQFYDAIKAKYPQLQLIATAKVKKRTPDLLDEHFYRTEEEMEAHAHDYDAYARTNHTKIFVGEWATRVGAPTPNMAGALGDAAWMTGMERNSDLVLISSYAPMFVNVSESSGPDRSIQWKSDLIGYDALTSYGSPSYYAQQMFSTHHGDTILRTEDANIPTYTWQPPAKKEKKDKTEKTGKLPPKQKVPSVFYDATRDSTTGMIILKVVNAQVITQTVNITLTGVSKVGSWGHLTVLRAGSRDETNALNDPKKIVPESRTLHGLGPEFTTELPPLSISIFEVKAK